MRKEYSIEPWWQIIAACVRVNFNMRKSCVIFEKKRSTKTQLPKGSGNYMTHLDTFWLHIQIIKLDHSHIISLLPLALITATTLLGTISINFWHFPLVIVFILLHFSPKVQIAPICYTQVLACYYSITWKCINIWTLFEPLYTASFMYLHPISLLYCQSYPLPHYYLSAQYCCQCDGLQKTTQLTFIQYNFHWFPSHSTCHVQMTSTS
jgi:hypothetical protein